MNPSSPYDDLPAGYSEDRPFCMSDPARPAVAEIQEITDSLKILSPDALRIRLPRNRLLGGLCLALSLSALLWIFAYYILQRLSV